jgi:hypothetical protein
MSACAAERGIDFCCECDEYPCDDLKQFQSAMPHRIELWVNLNRIKSVGYRQWLKEVRKNYVCPRCETINSTYDLKCRKCGREPSCNYVANHSQEIEDHLVDKASKLTGIKGKTMLVKLGLEALIARESSKRLAKLGGTEKGLKAIPRRRVTV